LLSHTACHALVPVARNATDEQLKQIATKGGVIGIFFSSKHASLGGADFSSTAIAWHVRHMIDVAGRDHVALGTGLVGISTKVASDRSMPAAFPNLFELLQSGGLSDETLETLAFKNAQRVLEAHLK